MTPAASTEEIRVAYLALAKRLHPDRLIDASPTEAALAGRRMREVNEAWRVLQDPVKRRSYDRDHLLAGRRPPARPTTTASDRDRDRDRLDLDHLDDDDDLGPEVHPLTGGLLRHLPWVVLVVVFGLIFVLTAYAGGKTADPAPTPRTEGTCVDVSPGPTTTVVPCSGPHEILIVSRVDETAACPPGTERRRLGTDGYLDCVISSP